MFKKYIGKRVLLRVTTPHCVNYVGTLKAAKGNVLSLIDVTPQRETRKVPDMVVNFDCGTFESVSFVSSEDDPSHPAS